MGIQLLESQDETYCKSGVSPCALSWAAVPMGRLPGETPRQYGAFCAVAFLLAATTVLSTAAARAEARTVRIEPRPFYGAAVTLEEGVRVFRRMTASSSTRGARPRFRSGYTSRTTTTLITTTTMMRASPRFPISMAATSASFPAESTFAVIASDTRATFVRFGARDPEVCPMQREIERLSGGEGRAS